MRNEIARLRSTQRTIVICTHNLAEAEALADMVAIIYKGRILRMGSLDDLKVGVLGVPEYEARFAGPWSTPSIEPPPGVCITGSAETSLRFSVEDPSQANPRLLQHLASLQAPLIAFQEVPRSLEDVYLRIMAEAQQQPAGANDA